MGTNRLRASIFFVFVLSISSDVFAHGRTRTLMTCTALGRSLRAPVYTVVERPSLQRGFEMEVVLLKSYSNPFVPDLEFPFVMTGISLYVGQDGVVIRINRGEKGAGVIYLDYRRRVSQFVLLDLQVQGEKGTEIWDTRGYDYTCSTTPL